MNMLEVDKLVGNIFSQDDNNGWNVWRCCILFVKKRILFFIAVVIPTILGILYYGFVASNIYISESKFIIRQPEKKSTSSLGMFLQSAGITSSHDDIYIIREYLQSRNVLEIIEENLKLSKAFSDDKIDFLQRYNALGFKSSLEKFFLYFKDYVTVDVDTTTSMCECKVKAFDPNLAKSINDAMLFLGEGFVNGLNNRAREDIIQSNLTEVLETEKTAKKAALTLSDYRNRQSVLDPNQQSSIQLQQISKIQSDLIDVRTQLSQYAHFASQTPIIDALKKRREELENEMKKTMSGIVGNNSSMAQKMITYDRLVLDVEFANKRLASAMASFEQSKSEAQRQQLYLERVVVPCVPDDSMYPKRMRNIFIIFICSLMIYGIIKFFLMGVREHQA